ncbi:hypothetical protein [Aeromicrobium sp.]|uniref:hypothetical protein n=1 Tax=Aeromicrobium sp. TaxID=1871063 RepID=UPI0028B015A9|nr:hypothetical protein [Aeromicrobium sp.]
MDDDHEDAGDDTSANRMAVGIALGMPFGVALSLMLDNWGLLGVGLLLGVAYGAIPAGTGDDSDPET